MDFISSVTERLSRLHPFVWLLGAIGFGALLAIFVFGVSVGTTTNYAFLALFWGGHMFMHRSHALKGHGSESSHRSHNSPASTDQRRSSLVEQNEKDPLPEAQDPDYSMGCH
jgi:hypothetical protein